MAARTTEPTIELSSLVASEAAPAHAASDIERDVLALFDAFRDPLLRYVCGFGISVGEGEDVIQDVFVALFKHLQQNGSRANLQGWLFRVAHNQALKRRVRQRRERDYVDVAQAAAHALSDTRHDLSVLPERDRHCVYLRGQGLRYREIAHVLGISLGAVAKIVARTIARLHRADEE
jgi:RNA polymerase sigma-70 factor (ECF subfamily)